MRIVPVGKPGIIMSNTGEKHNYFGWPTAKRLQDSRIAVAASGFRLYHVCPFGKAVIAFSDDEGKSYTAPAAVIDTVLDDRDAGLCTFGESGLILTSFNNTVEFQRECNQSNLEQGNENGKYIADYLDTVSPEEEKKVLGSTFKISTDCGKSFGELHVSPVTSPHGPIELKNSEILWVGATFRCDDAFNKGEEMIFAYTVSPDGTMTKVGTIGKAYNEKGERLHSNEPYAFQLSSGRIICHFRTEQNFTLYQSISDDNGRTWTEPERLMPDNGGAPAHIIEHSSGVLISAYGYREQPYGIRAMLSTDGGESWSTGHVICDGFPSDDLGYPTTVELSDGSLLTVFYAKTKKGAPCAIMQQRWELK